MSTLGKKLVAMAREDSNSLTFADVETAHNLYDHIAKHMITNRITRCEGDYGDFLHAIHYPIREGVARQTTLSRVASLFAIQDMTFTYRYAWNGDADQEDLNVPPDANPFYEDLYISIRVNE
jgi:hypothetical protein